MRLLAGCVLVAALVAAGCGQQRQLTLREAEQIGQLWLDDLRPLLAPPSTPVAQGAGEHDDAQADAHEDDPGSAPEGLRDCFVDDGWKPDGFPNPTAAIDWLTGTHWTVGKITSAELVDGGTELVFSLSAKQNVSVSARIVVEGAAPKCQSLKKSE